MDPNKGQVPPQAPGQPPFLNVNFFNMYPPPPFAANARGPNNFQASPFFPIGFQESPKSATTIQPIAPNPVKKENVTIAPAPSPQQIAPRVPISQSPVATIPGDMAGQLPKGAGLLRTAPSSSEYDLDDGQSDEEGGSEPRPVLARTEEAQQHWSETGARVLCAAGGPKRCTQRPMRGFSYCVKHILQDPNQNVFRQCEFITRSKTRCTNPVTIDAQDHRLCSTHRQLNGPKEGKFSKKRKQGGDADEDEYSNAAPKGRRSTGGRAGGKAPYGDTDLVIDDTYEDSEGGASGAPPQTGADFDEYLALFGGDGGAAKKARTKKPPVIARPKGRPEGAPLQGVKSESGEAAEGEGSGTAAAAISILSDSETESDQSDLEDGDLRRFISMSRAFRTNDTQTETEILRIRKERIETLLRLYRDRLNGLKSSLRSKYVKFLRAKERALNEAAGTSVGPFVAATEAPAPIQQSPSDQARVARLRLLIRQESEGPGSDLQVLVQPAEEDVPVIIEAKETVLEEPRTSRTGETLCRIAECDSRPMPLADFCFRHILHQPDQALYTNCTVPGCKRPVLKFSQPCICKDHLEQRRKYKRAATTNVVPLSTAPTPPQLVAPPTAVVPPPQGTFAVSQPWPFAVSSTPH